VLDRLFGFLFGSTLAGAGMYYYVLEEYKVSNEMLTEDIYVRFFLSFFHETWPVKACRMMLNGVLTRVMV